MINQEYLQIENNIVTNLVMWDGNTNTWQPPANVTFLPNATTPCMIWEYNFTTKVYELKQTFGTGQIGFTWDGNVLMTSYPKPIVAEPLNKEIPNL
jgi:hypothetical protein